MTAARPQRKPHLPLRRLDGWYAAGPALLFFVLGLPFLRKTGLHYDASSELACFYPCAVPVYSARLFGYELPVMVLQYLGALKAWLYLPVLTYLKLTPFALRLPFLICGAASVWLFGAVLKRISGPPAALIGALLLSTDLTFLVATSYDFGPIVLLHLFFLAGLLLLLQFDRTGKSWYLALAFFLFGFAFWEKALFIWMFVGLCAASAAAFPKRILARVTAARLAIAIVCLAAGAFPLLYYNVETGGGTLHTSNVISAAEPISQKLLILKMTLDSSILSGWMTETAKPETTVPPVGALGKASARLTHLTTPFASNWTVYLLAFACLLTPWLWFTPSRSAAIFGIVYLAVAWAQMAILANTGATVHHVILLWPMPQFLIAIAVAELWRRFRGGRRLAVGAATAAAILINLLVINSFYTELVTRGTSALWTDALYPLFSSLNHRSNTKVITADWGYSTSLCLLSNGEMPIRDISFMLKHPSPEESRWIESLMSEPESLFVDRAAGDEQFLGDRERLNAIAARGGFTRQVVEVIRDRNARERFDLIRYVKR